MVGEHFERVNCNLCKADDCEKISSVGQFGLPAHVVVCRKCGLTYLNPRWTQERYLDFYTNEYDDYHRPNINTAPIETGEPIFSRMKDLELGGHRSGLTSPSTILDIGSGAGANLNFFKRKFPESTLFAIEPSDNAIRILKGNGVEILARDIDSNWHEKHENKFDLIVMRHVLEHFSDPVGTLKKVRSTLTENGILYIGVPNNMKPKGDLESFWFRAVHTYYYGPETLGAIIRKSGMSPIQIQEGDHFSPNELFSFVSKGNQPLPVEFDSLVFDKQMRVFAEHKRQQTSFIRKLKNGLGKLRHKLMVSSSSKKDS